MIDCEVTKNDVKDSYGGGVYVGNVSSMYGFGYWSDSNYAGNTKGKDIYFSDMYGLNHSNSKAGNCSSGFTSVGTKPLDIGTFMGYVGAAYSYECVPFPTSMPSMIPSSVPTTQPSCLPSNIPTGMPTCSPSSVPSSMPTYIPSAVPSSAPTTNFPTTVPTSIPNVYGTDLIELVAGTGTEGYSGDGGAAILAQLKESSWDCTRLLWKYLYS